MSDRRNSSVMQFELLLGIVANANHDSMSAIVSLLQAGYEAINRELVAATEEGALTTAAQLSIAIEHVRGALMLVQEYAKDDL